MSVPVAVTLARVQRTAFLVSAVGGVLLALGFVLDRQRFFQAYLVAFLFVLAPAVGSLAFVMLHNLTGGAWGFAVRRLLEAATRTLPFVALLFVPIALGVHSLYEWSHAEVVAADPILQHKAAYLNVPFFVARAALYFALWTGLALFLAKLSERYDKKLSLKALRKLKAASGFGLAGYVLTTTFASFDWGMSLEPHWFSTIYGVHFLVGQGLSTLCLSIVMAALLAKHEPFSRWLSPAHFHDLGNLTLAFVMLWAYASLSQFLIIWSGNLPEENVWYLKRTAEGWQALALILVLCHFAAPFVILLVRSSKRNAQVLARLALVLLVMRFLDSYWLLAPAFDEGEFAPHWLDIVAPVTLGALWLGLFVRNLHGRPLVSLQDAKLLGELEVHA
ncbi:MAG: hypothetical protein EXS08_11890 [Planctomycetes bacterium]|nr:hypothetical protein [Planctomycetota bacterium]